MDKFFYGVRMAGKDFVIFIYCVIEFSFYEFKVFEMIAYNAINYPTQIKAYNDASR